MAETVGVLALLQAKPGKEDDLATLLERARDLALAELRTVSWYAFRSGEVTFGIFDTFESEAGRQAHLEGEIANALMAAAPDLLAADPEIRLVDLLAVK